MENKGWGGCEVVQEPAPRGRARFGYGLWRIGIFHVPYVRSEGETGDGRHVSIIQCDPLSHACCWVDPEYLLKARKHKVNSYFYDAMMTSGFLIFFFFKKRVKFVLCVMCTNTV